MDDRSGWRPKPAAPPTAPLALVPDGSGDVDPHREAVLTRLALAAQAGDRSARDALYDALRPKLDRMTRAGVRLTWAVENPRRNGRPWDQEDVRQEAFLVFSDLITAWSGEGAFTPYLFAYFPWRLRNAWRRLRPERLRAAMRSARPELAVDPTAVAEEARVLIEVLASRLPVEERTILLAHVRDGVTLAEVGRHLGLRPRQLRRRWQAIKRWLHGELELTASGRVVHAANDRPASG